MIAFCPLLVAFTCAARLFQVRDQRRSAESVSPVLGLVDPADFETKTDPERDIENMGSAYSSE